MSSLTAWLRQPTTITGLATLVSLLATVVGHYLTGDVTAAGAAGAIVFGVVHIAMPDNTAAATAAEAVTENLIESKTPAAAPAAKAV